jgi:transcriptional regulator with XRE-family HTH domain
MQTKPDQELIEKIRAAVQLKMRELGLAQSQVADEAGVSRSMLNELLKKNRLPSVSLLMKVAERLGVGVDFLLSGGEVQDIDVAVNDADIKDLLLKLASLDPLEKVDALKALQDCLAHFLERPQKTH